MCTANHELCTYFIYTDGYGCMRAKPLSIIIRLVHVFNLKIKISPTKSKINTNPTADEFGLWLHLREELKYQIRHIF